MQKIFTLLLLSVSLAFSDPLPYNLKEAIRHIPLNANNYSIHIQSLEARHPIVSWRTHVKRSPASVIKVLTTYAGVLQLGFDYHWDTKFYHTGNIRGGILRGDLYIKASGDPTLASKHIPSIVTQIQTSGIKKIMGNIVIDRSLFKVPNKNNSGFDNNTYSPYNAMPDAIMFNKRKSTFCVTPRGKHVRIDKDVPDQSYRIINKLRVVNGSCKRGRSWPRVSIKTNSSARSTITLSGKLSKRCGKRSICKVVSMPHRAFYYALNDGLKKQGIKLSGTLKLKRVPKRAKYLFSHYSEPLESVIATIAKKSDNLMARQLLLTLGTTMYPLPSTRTKGRQTIEKILNKHYILERGTTYISNGSGLSRKSKLTAQSLGNLLHHAATHYGQRWMNTLSIAGVDGTIRRRFQYSTVFGRAWMKTGTIKHVANIAGYVEGASGERYVVVVLVNDKHSSQYGRKLANAVIEWVADTK